MGKSTHRIIPALAALAGAAVGIVLRLWQLTRGSDIVGRIRIDHPSGIVLAVFAALAAAAIALLSRRLEPRSGYEESFSSGVPELAVSAAAALLLVFSSALSLMTQSGGIQKIIGTLGILAGLCIGVTAAQRFRGVVPPLSMHALPCVYLAFRLIFAFKRWSVDPVVQDYCYELFASIAAMCAAYHLGEFCLGRGRRRLTVFWCLAGVVFSAIALTTKDSASKLLYGAMLLWCAINAWQLLEDAGERR